MFESGCWLTVVVVCLLAMITVTGRLPWVRAVLLQWSRFIVFDVTVQAQTCPMEGSNLDCDITLNNARACLDKAGTEGI